MISKISLNNFKSFSKLDDLEIKPITILCGANSSGKSSILQSLLLWKQTLESRNLNQNILMNSRIHLGTFSNIVHNHDDSNNIVFGFEYEFTSLQLASIPYHLRRLPISILLRDLFQNKKTSTRDTVYTLFYEVELKSRPSDKNKIQKIALDFESVTIKIDTESIKGPYLKLKRQDNNKYSFERKNIKPRFHESEHTINKLTDDVIVHFSNLFPVNFESEDKNNDIKYDDYYVFIRIKELLRIIFNSISYIGPLREEPARRYVYEDEILEIGVKGENAAYIFLTEKDNKLRNHWYYNPKLDNFEKRKNETLQQGIQDWLSIMGISNLMPEQESEIIRILLDSNPENNTRVNIADVGFGVSQIFPILLEGLRIKKGQTLMLEQPEIHLHPNVQMQLSDYLISLALSGKKAIVETHSDHIVNRLVRRMIEDQDLDLINLIAIYFIKNTDEGSIIEPIEIDPFSGIVNWPKDFFDQTANEQLKIIQATSRNWKRRND